MKTALAPRECGADPFARVYSEAGVVNPSTAPIVNELCGKHSNGDPKCKNYNALMTIWQSVNFDCHMSRRALVHHSRLLM